MIPPLLRTWLFSVGLLLLSHLSTAHAQATYNLTAGWNLLGNGTNAAIPVAATFSDTSKIYSVWKWNKTTRTWAFYAPSLSASALAAYAQGKGYDVLTTLAVKDGFWVNAAIAATITASSEPFAAPPSAGATVPSATLTETDLALGWNLIGNADGKTPSQLNSSLSSSLTAAGKSIVTVWAWHPSTSTWRFYAPELESQGGTALADYISSKGYLQFTSPPAAADGLWINIGTGPTTGTDTSPRTTAEGLWQATLSGVTVEVAVLENGDTWGVYIDGGLIWGAFHGTTSSSGTTLSGSGTDFYILYKMISPGSYSGTYSAKGSIRAATSAGVEFSGTYDTAYDQAASLATLGGTFSGSGVTGLSSTQSISVAITDHGIISASSGGCAVSGTATPRASGKNIFDVALNFAGASCTLGNGSSASGIGYYDSARRSLLVMGMKSDGSDGFIYVGTKP